MQESETIRIARDGVWYYGDSQLERMGLVRLFYSALQRLQDGYYITTPVESVRIFVEDAPYAVVDVEAEGGGVTLCLNEGTWIPLTAERVPRMNKDNVLYVIARLDRHGNPLEARFTLAAYLRFAEYLQDAGDGTFRVCSFGREIRFA